MWVLQEVLLGRDVVMQWGEAVIPFKTLRMAVSYALCERVPLIQGILDSFSLYGDIKPRTGLENFFNLIQLLEIYLQHTPHHLDPGIFVFVVVVIAFCL